MKRPIVGYHCDEDNYWVAELKCGHNQHVRHQPPWINRAWTQTTAGRDAMRGHMLECKKCDAGAPPDPQPGRDG